MAPTPLFSPSLRNLPYSWSSDPESGYGAMAPMARIKQFRSLVPRKDFRQFVGHLPLHRAQLMAIGSSAVQFSLEDVPVLLLNVCFFGHRDIHTPHGDVVYRPGGAVLLPAGDRNARGACSTAVVSLRPEEVERAAAAMAGQRADDNDQQPARWDIFRPLAWGGERAEARQIHALLHYIDRCAAVDPLLPVKLALDDVLHRLAAALLQPSLLQHTPAEVERLHTRDGRSAFDDLIAYIRANLDQPLRLSDLEARSHYSRRALQYAFQEKLHTSPKQWIRRQRLKAAMEQLQSAEGKRSVEEVGLSCGYQRLSHFSSEFKREYGIAPSAVVRAQVQCARRH